MRTVLSKFSQEFVRSIRPLLEPLEGAADALGSAQDGAIQREVLPSLREVQHQLRILVDKVADQHAFVLIFGPLKSGKSTLMNALAAAYVSEVTSLPAYPCMVYVSHADERSFRLTRYNGRAETIHDTATLQMLMQRSHGELAQALRRAEEAGEEFEPAVHFPEAIRRIDVRMPAGDLAQSGAVLVDTPGLYSRMKFGYDRMTREFRNVAACAIFVVKSDNLFLEQVFQEFGDLLGLFSRIFLVINVDSTKMDLGPRGELVPSVEQTDPLRIVEAFESFAMSAPLKRAAEEGRLRIYPIDLLRAARRRLRGDEAEDEGSGRETSFATFQGELADFLNSTDYLVAFIQDSLRRADTLLGDLGEVCRHEAVREMSRRLAALREERRKAEWLRTSLQKLADHPWEADFDQLQERLAQTVQERARHDAARTAERMDQAIERWFGSSASLQSLVDDELVPALLAHREELFGFALQTIEAETAGAAGGLAVSSDVEGSLRDAEIQIDELSRRALASVKTTARFQKVAAPLSGDDIPVRKSLLDWILFRSRAAIRTRLFGPTERPTVRVSLADKSGRLGDPAKQVMKQAVDRSRGAILDSWGKALQKGVLAEHGNAVAKALQETLDERSRALAARIRGLDVSIQEANDRTTRLERLAESTGAARRLVEAMRAERGKLDPELLEAEEEALAAAGRALDAEGPQAEPEDSAELSDVILTPAPHPDANGTSLEASEEETLEPRQRAGE